MLINLKVRSLILIPGFRDSCFQNLSNLNKTVHGDKTELPPISHKGLKYLRLLLNAAVTCTKRQISKVGPQTKTNS